MPLRDILKKEKRAEESRIAAEPPQLPPTDFTFLRTDSGTQEVISPPGRPSAGEGSRLGVFHARHSGEHHRGSSSSWRERAGSTASSVASSTASASALSTKSSSKSEKRLSHRLRLRSASAASSASSVHVPADLPPIDGQTRPAAGGAATAAAARNDDDREAQWEKRATLLARENAEHSYGLEGAAGASDGRGGLKQLSLDPHSGDPRSRSRSPSVSDPGGDVNIQEAIRLHEQGDLARSTAIFGRLADPSGANNALSQVLYGLALRHGWGIPANPSLAVKYLSTAAAHTAEIERQALESGMKRGGAAKGELVLAIFELANCFRNGWGVARDPVAAKQYYETAANLGDPDACNEVAWCYLEGFGTKKDKFQSARYYRKAEGLGNKTLGNSWIWKEKYDEKA